MLGDQSMQRRIDAEVVLLMGREIRDGIPMAPGRNALLIASKNDGRTRGKSPHYLRLRGFYFGDSNQILNATSELY